MSWIEPIIDRVLSDIELAFDLSQNSELVGTPPLKGALNSEDFNRISNNLLWIKDNIPLDSQGFPIIVIPPNWQKTDFFRYSNLNNYEKNIYYIKDLYFLSMFFPAIDFGEKEVWGDYARSDLHFEKINQWERILLYIYTFAYLSPKTWQDVDDNFNTWQEVYDFYKAWGFVLIL